LNLFSNAIKVTKQRDISIIEVNCRPKLDRIIYSERDKGVGFCMGKAKKLFTVFHRPHREEDFEGTG